MREGWGRTRVQRVVMGGSFGGEGRGMGRGKAPPCANGLREWLGRPLGSGGGLMGVLTIA